jgi:RHH-type proline utilization regulon transcriptional repressor/proline dehydrogenase/delta 1-pyrroline-5-carboxylate dehydrogenase
MFVHEPFLDFSQEAVRDKFEQALAALAARVKRSPLRAHALIAGKRTAYSHSEKRLDPCDPSIVLGETEYSGPNEVEAAIRLLSANAQNWADCPIATRVQAIRKVGQLLSAKRYELAALIVREAAKPWKEADADVVEAIDFCNYYAHCMEQLAQPRKTEDVPGEENIYFYQPRGLSVVIAPWNFPLAIACGMTVAALVSGNPTILKPAEQTSLIGFELGKIILEAGVPPYAFALLPGSGETIGRSLVQDARTALICFTGSKAVGLEILQSAAELKPGQAQIKRVITELGGKNAIIVDDDADFDEAIRGVIYSAFGYSGQKCSACSRLIIVNAAYEPFLKRLKEAAADIIIGPAAEAASLVSAVIDEEAKKRILATLDQTQRDGELLFKSDLPKTGYYVPVTILRNVKTESALWREEIFGPVLACVQARDFSQALKIATDCQYALTGGLYSRSPSHIALARKEFKVGNLYINRGCTGAIVQRQPFGGFKLSGVGSKAGGPDYLLQFLEPRVITENTLRRGFAPE